MKFVILLLGVGATLPLALWLRSGGRITIWFWVFFGFSPFLLPAIPHGDIALVSWYPQWIGLLSGAEIAMIDLLALAAYLSLPHTRSGLTLHGPPLLYLCAIALSALQADQPVAAMFYVLQFCRIYFFIVVTTHASKNERLLLALLQGMAIGICFEAAIVIWQRAVLHAVQTSGTFAHQNTLGLVTHFVVLPHLALLLAGRRGVQVLAAPIGGTIVTILTTSRAALLFAGVGFVILLTVSTLRRWTTRKAIIALGCLLVGAMAAPLALSSFEKRFELAPLMEDEYDERGAFNRTAELILEDRPFGVGVNHYVHIAKNFGYSERGGVAPFEGSRNNIVHNVYWLTASETGYLGLAAFLVMILTPMVIAFRVGWRHRNQVRGDLLIGFGVSFLAVYMHSTLEYILVSKESQYVFALAYGCTLGLATQLRAMATATPPAGAEALRIGAPRELPRQRA